MWLNVEIEGHRVQKIRGPTKHHARKRVTGYVIMVDHLRPHTQKHIAPPSEATSLDESLSI
jgi:hypothetical protein